MTTTKCIVCNKEFIYKGYKNKCCSDECLSIYRKNLSLQQHNLSVNMVIDRIEQYIVNNYEENKIVKTLKECLIELHIAPKTYYRYCKEYNISYDALLSKNNISKPHSKFQTSVISIIKKFYETSDIIEEATLDGCINPKTNYNLRFDAYIKDKSIAIECDGVQHNKENSYFNKLVILSGYTPTYITDKIKEEYCKNNNIKLIRIPYSRRITKEYVESFLSA